VHMSPTGCFLSVPGSDLLTKIMVKASVLLGILFCFVLVYISAGPF